MSSNEPCRASQQVAIEGCGCCEGVTASTPVRVENRMALPTIVYRIGEQPQFKESLLAGLSSSSYARLGLLQSREPADFTIGFLDAVACAADVLTFYQERIANESYLRTATERISLQELGKLIGYRLRPGVAAETPLAFALERPKTPPAGLPLDPGAFVTGIPPALTLASGLKVQSVPGPDDKPQIFETVEAIDARPQWNAMRPWLSAPRTPGSGAKETWVKGVATNLKPGDALVFVHADFHANPTTSTNWDFRLVHTVEPEPEADRTRLTWQDGLENVSSAEVHALRKRTGVFGHNAPRWKSMNASFREDYAGADQKDDPDWPEFTISTLPASATDGHVDLDAVYGDIKSAGLAVLTRKDIVFGGVNIGGVGGREVSVRASVRRTPSITTLTRLYLVSGTSEVSRAAFALSGKVTRIAVRGQALDKDFFEFVRDTSAYAQSEALPLAAYPVTNPIEGDVLPLAVSPDGLLAGRTLIVSGSRVDNGRGLVHRATLVRAELHSNGALLTIAPPLPTRLERHSVVVYGNVANATHGETVSEVLGSGDASESFQRFELKRLPLTYRSATNETGADSQLSVRVGDVEWQEVPTLFGTGPNDRVYSLDIDEQGRRWVAFGDGVRGARLPSGVNNVRATYRQGLGKEGNVEAERLTQLQSRPLGLKSVSNPLPAEGGTHPEPAERARRSMPLGTRTLGRAVSLLDYEDFALAFTGIAKAQARVLQLAGGPTIAITIAAPNGSALSFDSPVWKSLEIALQAGGDPFVRIQLLPYQASTFRIGLKVKRDPAYQIERVLARVEQALRTRYGFEMQGLGEPVSQSEVIAVAHSVPGVVAVDLDFLYGGTAPLFQTRRSRQRRLLASQMRVEGGLARPAELLTLHPGPPERLQEMP